MHQSLCVCDALPLLDVDTTLVVALHRDEERKTTNTGRLAALCLRRAHIVVHGDRERPAEPPPFDAARAVVLFPSSDAQPLTPALASGGPLTLVVPDGNWRQADKMARRLAWMRDLPRVVLSDETPTSYRLRSEPRRGGLATMEAIARALGVLHGDAVARALDAAFTTVVERTLFSRGRLAHDAVFGGLAPHVRADRPWQTSADDHVTAAEGPDPEQA